MPNELIKKTFLDVNDVRLICCCGKNKAYNIIKLINDQITEEGYIALPGKVLASALYKKLDMLEQLDMHKKAWEKGNVNGKRSKDPKDNKKKR